MTVTTLVDMTANLESAFLAKAKATADAKEATNLYNDALDLQRIADRLRKLERARDPRQPTPFEVAQLAQEEDR